MKLYRLKTFDTTNGYQTLFLVVNDYGDVTRYIEQQRFQVEEVKLMAKDTGTMRIIGARWDQ